MNEMLGRLREQMRRDGIDAVLVTTTDPHASENVAPHWRCVQALTGFSGSAGFAWVLQDAAAFWTDGRYSEQAGREIDAKDFEVFTLGRPGDPPWTVWLGGHAPGGCRAAVTGAVTSEARWRRLMDGLSGIGGGGVTVDCGRDLPGSVWRDRPPVPVTPVWEMPEKFAGASRREKLRALRRRLSERVAAAGWPGRPAAGFFSSPDDVAWLTNLRGGDHPLHPVFHAVALVGGRGATLFTEPERFSPELLARLEADGWRVRPAADVPRALGALSARTVLCADAATTSMANWRRAQERCRGEGRRTVLDGPDVLSAMKAVKSAAEQANIREANLKECVAIVRLMRWIEERIARGEAFDEWTTGARLEDFRRLDPEYLQPGNVPIVGYGANAALPHYRPTRESAVEVSPRGFLLFDVCAQYLGGTTDITRTVAVGALAQEERIDYTVALKAHVTLARQRFPEGTTGNLLDAVVKAGCWNRLMDFRHGTGHGIGYVLNVHEGPAKIALEPSPAFPRAQETPLEAGMLFSNEPGVYRPGSHGVRLENSVLVRPAGESAFGRFLGFETVTFLPFERKAVVVEMLAEDEREWIDAYHRTVLERLSPRLSHEEAAWLAERCRPL